MEKKKAIRQGPSLKYTSSKDYKKPGKIANPYLQALGAPHVDSFNYAVNEGLDEAIKDLYPAEFESSTGEKVSIRILGASFSKPQVMMDGLSSIGVKKLEIMPTECRQRAATYKGELIVRVNVTVNEKSVTIDKSMGCLPVMVKSKLCHLDNMSPQELIDNNEHADEWGGYFIIKGNERLARMLIVNRRNYPTTVKRPGWKTRGNMFTDLGVLVRSVKPDQTSTNNVLHFLSNGTAKLMFSHRRMMYYAPLIMIMKCLVDYPDHMIYRILLAGHKKDLYFVSCIQNMFRELHEEGLHTSADCRHYLGQMFKQKISDLPKWCTEEQVTDFLTKNSILIHLNANVDKFHALVFMTQKLFSFVQNKCKPEGSDTVMAQEVLTGGHLYLIVLKDRLQTLIYGLKKAFQYSKKSFDGAGDLEVLLRRCGTFETKMETFLATGNAPASYVSLPQLKGLAIIAENINRMRYMSHFKSLHRGSFFLEMRTTEARQLSGDAWGFVCPVHTPDGSPCGLLNHLAQNAQISGRPDSSKLVNAQQILFQCGVEPVSRMTDTQLDNDVYEYPVFLDGKLMGFMPEHQAKENCAFLRTLKIKGDLPISTEIVLVPKKEVSGQFPGIFLFTNEARMMRPVINLSTGQLELIGTMEQLYLDIAVSKSEIYSGITTHLELSKDAFLSNLALLVPMPDCNQSPRNMYQCQMGKQTMGTPIHNWPTNADTKLYRLQTPATPLFRPTHYDNISLDDYPMGTNAIVAVISYTGYDMEDAMIINKSAHQRGFAAGSIYKTEFIVLDNNSSYFGKDPANDSLAGCIDDDGLPAVGARIQFEDPFYSYYDSDRSGFVVCKYRGKEEVFVDSVRLCGDTNDKAHKKACIVFRIPRNPTVGDKFASRAGQKGICSQLWPAEDLPFTESGLIPDILFNPHGFPSRMTIAMMIECMAGKSASLHGQVHDASPFRFNEQDTAIDYFGRLLTEGGYNYYGTERMYSGADGREMVADIFFGVIHYQRLRHMVSDKWQVRTTGAIDSLTRQPVKGRRRGGGVRLGEMERDALLAHGSSFLLHDRLFHCSDKAKVLICTNCGSLLGPISVKDSKSEGCRLCDKAQLSTIAIPYVFKLFVTQLAAVNINVKINCIENNNAMLLNRM